VGPAVPFYGVPSIANLGAASFLSPADLQNLLTVGPGPEGAADSAVTLKVDTAWLNRDDLRIPLFHRGYPYPAGSPDPPDGIMDRTANGIGVLQALMDFVNVIDLADDGVDNDGNGVVDMATGDPDPGELRIPGRLNVNTIGSDFLQLDAGRAPGVWSPLLFIDRGRPWDANFWQRFIEFRDLTAGSWYPGSRAAEAVGGALPNYPDHVGLEQLGELCNFQYTGDVNFIGFWQDRASLSVGSPWPTNIDTNGDSIPDFLLPAQHTRRFARNANLLTTRSDTYMVTLRVELVRPAWQDRNNNGVMEANEVTAIQSLGQREYMYLIDRSYCLKAPQQLPVGLGDDTWGTHANPLFNGQVNPDFVAPRVWRMTIPRYAAYGG